MVGCGFAPHSKALNGTSGYLVANPHTYVPYHMYIQNGFQVTSAHGDCKQQPSCTSIVVTWLGGQQFKARPVTLVTDVQPGQ